LTKLLRFLTAQKHDVVDALVLPLIHVLQYLDIDKDAAFSYYVVLVKVVEEVLIMALVKKLLLFLIVQKEDVIYLWLWSLVLSTILMVLLGRLANLLLLLTS